MASASKATVLPQSAAFQPRDSHNRFHDMSSRDGLSRLVILRGLIETWKEGVDRNLSWFNQLVKVVD